MTPRTTAKSKPAPSPKEPRRKKGSARPPRASAGTGDRTDRGAGSVPVNRIDPRIRERRVEVVRRQGRRRLRRLLAVLLVAALVAGAWFILHSRLLSARVVTVSGSVHTPVSEIISVAGLSDHPPLIDVNGGASAAKLEQLSWVRTATVTRQWPDGVHITVAERTPVAAVSVAAGTGTGGTTGSWALVDRTGKVLADVASPPAGLVHLVPPSPPGAPGSELAAAGPGLAVATTLPAAFAKQVTAVTQAKDGQVTLHLATPVTVDLGSATRLHQKYEDVAALLAGASLTAGDVLDVTVPGAPVISGG